MRRFRSLALCCGILLGAALHAQYNGVRGIFPHFDKTLVDVSAFRRWSIGLGYDRQTDGPLAFGVDFHAPIIDVNADGDYNGSRSISHLGYTASYHSKVSGWTLLYRTSYFTSGDGSGFYVGSFLGVRKVKETLTLGYVDASGYNSDNGPFREVEVCQGLVFPLGVRIGVRGDMDGWYQDLYFQVGYHIGKGDLSYGSAFMDKGAPVISGLTYSLGYGFGLGW